MQLRQSLVLCFSFAFLLGRLAGEQRGVAVVVVQQVKCIWNKFRAEFVKVKEGKKA